MTKVTFILPSLRIPSDCLHGSWTCAELSGHWRLFVLVSFHTVFVSGYVCQIKPTTFSFW